MKQHIYSQNLLISKIAKPLKKLTNPVIFCVHKYMKIQIKKIHYYNLYLFVKCRQHETFVKIKYHLSAS